MKYNSCLYIVLFAFFKKRFGWPWPCIHIYTKNWTEKLSLLTKGFWSASVLGNPWQAKMQKRYLLGTKIYRCRLVQNSKEISKLKWMEFSLIKWKCKAKKFISKIWRKIWLLIYWPSSINVDNYVNINISRGFVFYSFSYINCKNVCVIFHCWLFVIFLK